MSSFISKVINETLTKNLDSIEKLIYVLPSQRACVFLKNEIIRQLTKTSFLPKIVSIENYIQEIAGIDQIDSIQLLFDFYSVYLKHTNEENQDSFEIFSQWATIAIQDFNEIDRHLINGDDLFSYLRDINRLDNWNPTTTLTKNYFSFFEKLHIYYNEFYNWLKSRSVGYQGLIYREAESNIEQYIKANNDRKIFLVGFNALNKAEELIFQKLLESGLASIYFDADQSYFNETNSTGMFIRKFKSKWNYFKQNNFEWTENYLTSIDKKVEFIGASKNVSQFKYVGELLEKQENHQNTALILADESMLSLSLGSLPSTVEKINITMGFPLKDIPLASFFTSIFDLLVNQEKLNSANKFYFKDVLAITEHAYFKRVSEGLSSNLTDEIRNSNLVFISVDDLETIFQKSKSETLNNLLILFSDKLETVDSKLQNFIDVCQLLKDKTEGIEKEYVYRFYTVFQQLKTLNEEFRYIKNTNTLHQFYQLLLNNEKLSFQGEPLEGLQLMGMLESRVIDFETVIMTSVNEGVLPKSKSEQSFIPFDVKIEFKLPTYREKDAIFAYHFYRLMHRSKKMYFIYNTDNDVYGGGEKSRFLTQLENRYDGIKHSLVSPKVEINKVPQQKIEKSEDLVIALNKLAKKGISPSAIASYINNPIDFYYQKILKISEPNEIEETVAANTMGTVIHDVLEKLYTPYINKILSEESIDDMRKLAPELVYTSFKKEYKNGDVSKGKNKLILEVSKKYVDRFLLSELNDIKKGNQIKIVALEQNLSEKIRIDSVETPIKLHGIVDRIDTYNGTLRIIDYKSGMVKKSELKLNDFSLMSEDYKYTKALQVMLYAFLYLKNPKNNSSQSIEAGIISFKNLNEGFMKMNFSDKFRVVDPEITQERINDFLKGLETIIAEIFNPEVPFTENLDRKY